MNPDPHGPPTVISPNRLVAFSDGIFAIAITLLIFNLKIPALPPRDHHRLSQAMAALLPTLLTYFMTFLLIAVFWFLHHQMFTHIRRVDNTFIWLNIAYLLAISFLPFPVALLGAYPDELVSLLFYTGNMSAVSAMLLSMWVYAYRGRRLVENDLSPAVFHLYLLRGIVSQVFFGISILLAFFRLGWAEYFLFSLIPAQLLLNLYLARSRR